MTGVSRRIATRLGAGQLSAALQISTARKPSTLSTPLHLLVDFENLQPPPEHVARVRGESSHLWVFHGPHQNKFDAALVKAWQPLGDRVDFVQSSKHGKNALDFHIAFKLGELIADQRKTGRRASYVVVSGDGGFEPLFDYMRTQGCTVTRVGSIPDALAVPASTRTSVSQSWAGLRTGFTG